jgi:hypothetical protein
MAQLVARFVRIEEVRSSNLLSSTLNVRDTVGPRLRMEPGSDRLPGRNRLPANPQRR